MIDLFQYLDYSIYSDYVGTKGCSIYYETYCIKLSRRLYYSQNKNQTIHLPMRPKKHYTKVT